MTYVKIPNIGGGGGDIGVGKQKRFCTFASKNLKSNNLVMIYLLLMV